jgi:hypothetical protein
VLKIADETERGVPRSVDGKQLVPDIASAKPLNSN